MLQNIFVMFMINGGVSKEQKYFNLKYFYDFYLNTAKYFNLKYFSPTRVKHFSSMVSKYNKNVIYNIKRNGTDKKSIP